MQKKDNNMTNLAEFLKEANRQAQIKTGTLIGRGKTILQAANKILILKIWETCLKTFSVLAGAADAEHQEKI
jgi:hypothetical protein